ncbi:MAG TPA: hypothetical protein VFW70_20555 [Methylomirabilota bacterium]|nr:hypothetical protein [Methylomirabilota bacterium]
MLRRLLAALVLLGLAGCVTARKEAAASPRAGCEVTGGDWDSASQRCEKR